MSSSISLRRYRCATSGSSEPAMMQTPRHRENWRGPSAQFAANGCLAALGSASGRPPMVGDIPEVDPPEPPRLGEVVWLEPYPDALLEGAIDVPLGPAARYEQTEAISLAFVTALQVLPARQRAVLILRDVLGYHANEVADMLDSTVESVTSALKRARASLQRRLPPTGERDAPPAPDSPAEQAL